MEMVQVCVLGVAGVLFALQLKTERAELAALLCVGISALIFICMADYLRTLVLTIKEISSMVQMDVSYISILLKMLGITYVAEFSSGICRDAGYQAIASQIEVFGKIAILVLSMPILLTLLKTIQEFWV